MGIKARVLLIGCGGVGSISALNLETGGKAAVTAVVRSSYDVVKDRGFNIKSIDHGVVKGFMPSTGECLQGSRRSQARSLTWRVAVLIKSQF